MCGLELYEAIRTRRSIRRYRPDSVPDQIIRKIIEAASWAPSSSNSQPWEFVVVRDGNTLERLSKTHAYAVMLKGAPLCIVACSDPERSPNHWVEDCSIAVENMLLAARAEGLGTVGSRFIGRTMRNVRIAFEKYCLSQRTSGL